MSHEITYPLTSDERNTLLFLTGGLKVFKASDLDENSKWNIKEYFGYNRSNINLLKVIIFKDKVVAKVAD